MGTSSSKKLASKSCPLTADEQKVIVTLFRNASNTSEKIKNEELIVSGTLDADSLERYWQPVINERLTPYIVNFLFGMGPRKARSVDFSRFAQLYVYNVRGDLDERLLALYNCIGKEYTPDTVISHELIHEYCDVIVATYFMIIKDSRQPAVYSWTRNGFVSELSRMQALSEAIAEISDADSMTDCNFIQLRKWFQTNLLLQQMIENVFISLFGLDKEIDGEPPPVKMTPLLPKVEDLFPDYPGFIDLSQICWLNKQLPLKYQHKWRFVFSTHVHGESFATFTGRIQNQGPTVVLIEDSSGYVFGGYASDSWLIRPNFYGTPDCFLFSLSPKLKVFDSTTFNDHYQYLNHHTKTMKNGLMMGGQFEMPAIWVNADPFGEGSCADSCSTFKGYKRLSKEPHFRIKSLEVWGVGDPPMLDKDLGERDVSVLDANPEAKAILDMAGRTRHSDGIREPPPL